MPFISNIALNMLALFDNAISFTKKSQDSQMHISNDISFQIVLYGFKYSKCLFRKREKLFILDTWAADFRGH